MLQTWSVNEVDSMLEPVETDGSRVDGDASLSLLLHEVHHSIPVIHI